MKKRAVIYGAGNYCKLLLKGSQLDEYHIVSVIDSNPVKWGKSIEGILIEKPDMLEQLSYDLIIIATKSHKSIAEKLIGELEISTRKIFYYDFDGNKVCSIKESDYKFAQGKESYLERRLFREIAIQTIEEGLLFECYCEGEFDNYEELAVIGGQEEFNIIKKFFANSEKRLSLVQEIETTVIDKRKKYVLAASTYKEDFESLLQKKGCMPEQCVVIPLFDVKNTLVF